MTGNTCIYKKVSALSDEEKKIFNEDFVLYSEPKCNINGEDYALVGLGDEYIRYTGGNVSRKVIISYDMLCQVIEDSENENGFFYYVSDGRMYTDTEDLLKRSFLMTRKYGNEIVIVFD